MGYRISLAMLVAVAVCRTAPAEFPLTAKPEVVEAWKDMRFGMFLCWGPVTLTGKEIGWSRGAPAWGRRKGMRGGKGSTPAEVYDELYTKWKPDKFDAELWVKIAKDAGQKYLIFLVKHHDGFCLYDTKLTDYKSTGARSAWKVDAMKHVADACHKHDLKLIIYYSQPDWRHRDYLGENHKRYIEYLHGQVRELLTNYGKIDGLWFDNLRGRGNNPAAAKLWDAEKLFAMARKLQPHLIINDRCGLQADFYTPEQHVGRVDMKRTWESCITLGTQWSWKPNDKLKPYTDGLRMLILCAVGDGNLALNTNPMPDGRIEPRQAASFAKIGKWMRKYGASIYGTRGGPFLSPDRNARRFNSARDGFKLPSGRWWGGSTHKGKSVYLHILRWPGEAITLPPIDRKIISHSVLTGGKATVRQIDSEITVTVAEKDRDALDTIVKLELDGPAADVKPGRLSSGSLASGKKATASGVWPNPRLDAGLAFDDDMTTRWGGAPDSKSGWLAVDLGAEKTFARVFISEAYDRVGKFELQKKTGEIWTTFHEGAKIGESFSASFKPVTARHVRLNIVKASHVPTIWEVQLFPPKRAGKKDQ
ncbi:MAG: alpha-L-fucosidase [Phycisphaerae bacterium]|jgi:alpha-L-fucosidase|nr:alpha-L-fucosidase [Phycisphaerae bacterium]